MSYIKAEEILPKELIETIQQYVSGKNIYIPCKEKKVWGSQTKTKQYYKARNHEICTKYKNGVSIKILANEYSLSEKSIQRILRTTNKKEFINSGKFRVNANGNRVDVWLIYRCKKCKHSWNLTIYERVRPSRIEPEEYELFMENDYALALIYGNDIGFLKRNNAEFK